MIKIAINSRHSKLLSGGGLILRRAVEAIRRYSVRLKVFEYGTNTNSLTELLRQTFPPKADLLFNLMPPCSFSPFVKQISYIHDIPLDRETHTLKEHIYNRIYLPSILRYSDLVVVPTEFTKQSILIQYPKYINKVRILPYPLDTAIYYGAPHHYSLAQFKEYFNIKPKFLLSVQSSNRWRKGTDLITPIFTKLPKQIQQDYSWVVVGKINRASYSHPHVVYTGDIEDSILLDLYKDAAVTVVPSRYEGFGLVALESAASGTDCVCSDLPSLREACSPKTRLAISENIDSFANAISETISDPMSYTDVHYRHANSFSYLKFVERLEGIINELSPKSK